MIGVKSYAEKAIDAVARNRAALQRAQRASSDHESAKPQSDDADALYAWRRDQRDLDDRITAAQEALAFAEKRAEEARAEAAERAADAAHAAGIKQRDALVPIVNEIPRLAAKLHAAILKVEEGRKATDKLNAARGSRPFIMDAEQLVRTIPAKHHPAQYRDEIRWEDGAGNRPHTYRNGKNGELEPTEKGFVRKVVKVEQSAERTEPARLPRRYINAFELVDAESRPLKLD